MSGEDIVGSESSDDDVLRLNVGGEKMQVLRRTLTFCGGMLAAKFSGRWDLPRDLDGYIVLDHDPKAFGALIAILREKVVETPRAPLARVPSPVPGALCRLLEYYDLTMAVCPVFYCRGRPPSWKEFATFVPSRTTPKLKEGTEIHLQESDCYYFWSPGNRVLVHSFEIEVTQVVEGKTLEIGWFSPEGRHAVLDCCSGELGLRRINRDGGKVHKDESLLKPFGGPVPANARVCSEDRGAKWSIDGSRTDGWLRDCRLRYDVKNVADGRYNPIPYFAGEGTCKIVSFEYEFVSLDL